MAEVTRTVFEWFEVWVTQNLGACLTFAGGLSRQQMVDGFGLGSYDPPEQTFDEADDDPSHPKVRIGQFEGWAYAVEHFTTVGAEQATLHRLSIEGREAFSLAFTQTISMFAYAKSGVLVNGFDLDIPGYRYGTEEHCFDATMEQAGFLGPGPTVGTAMGARFVQLTFGVTMDLHMLTRPLPSYDVYGIRPNPAEAESAPQALRMPPMARPANQA